MTATTPCLPPTNSAFAIGDAESAGTRAHLGPRCYEIPAARGEQP